jgi:hypothetical protein
MRYSSRLALFLSGFGIFVFGCHDADTVEGSATAASDLSPADQFLMSQALAKLPPKVANAVRDSLAAAPGPKTQHSLIQLFGAPKMIELAKAADEAACTQSGADAVLAIADWAKSFGSHATDRGAVDTQESGDLDAMRSRLATIDVKDIDKAIDELSCAQRGTGSTCDSQLFPPPSCDGDTTSTDNGCASTTTCAFNDVPDVRQERDRAEAAESKLASIFRELDTVRPSRAMQGEWNLLRDRYRAGLSQAARETIQAARRGGSATLARDGYSQRRFDEGSRMIDAFVRGQIAFNADAMNLVHAAVASKDLGRIRTAGQEAFRGRGGRRPYLPGAAVARATNDVFAAVRARRGESAPLVAAMFDQRMISIHPYMDANGRTTRLMTDWLLAREGFPPALATSAAPSSVLHWDDSRIARDAHLEHITEGMRRTVELVEAAG